MPLTWGYWNVFKKVEFFVIYLCACLHHLKLFMQVILVCTGVKINHMPFRHGMALIGPCSFFVQT